MIGLAHLSGSPRRSGTLWAACIACIGVLAAPAWANPGSSMWFEVSVLILGNFVIGLVEGGVLWAMGSRWWALPLMLFANYFSAWLGWSAVWAYDAYWSVFDSLGGDPLRHAVPAVWVTFAGLTLFGLVVEAPFYIIAFVRSNRFRWRRAFLGLLVANGLTTAGLGAFYLDALHTGLLHELRPADRPGAVAGEVEGEPPWLYFIAPDNHTVARVRLGGSGEEVVRRFDASLEDSRLLAIRDGQGAYGLALSQWDSDSPLAREVLQGRPLEDDETEGEFLRIGSDVGSVAGVFGWDLEHGVGGGEVVSIGLAADLRSETARGVKVTMGFEGWEGLTVEDSAGRRSLTLDGPFIFGRLTPRSATVLPGDVLVFELAHLWDDHHAGIYIASLRSRTIARLCDGRSPVVVYPHGDGG